MTAGPSGASTSPEFLGIPAIAALEVGADGVVRRWTHTAQAFLGYDTEDVVGHPVAEFIAPGPQIPALVVDDIVEACRERGDWAGLLSALHRDGTELPLGVRVFPLVAPGQDRSGVGWLVLLFDVQHTRWWGADRTLLDHLLNQAPIGMGVVAPDLTMVWLNDALVAAGGIPRERRLGRPFGDGLQHGLPIAWLTERVKQVMATGEPVIELEYEGHTQALPRRRRWYAASFFRIEDTTGRILGVCYIALDVTERVRSRRRLALLGEVGSRIGTTLDVGRTAQELTDAAVPSLADFAAVDLLEPSGEGAVLVRAGLSSSTPGALDSIADPGERVQLYPDSPGLRSLSEGTAHLHADLKSLLDDPSAPWINEDHRTAERVRRYGLHSLMVVPVRARGTTLGVAHFFRSTTPEPFESDDLLLAQEFVARAAVCIDNARRYTHEHTAALALQRSLLPGELPRLGAVEATSAYLPSDSSVGVGGDWYDVIPLSGARVALVVGDVTGHGLLAAATMGRLRAAVHTLADLDLPPDELLAHLDDLVTRFVGQEEEAALETGSGPVRATAFAASCLYAVYDPVSRRLTVARAGHPPPLFATPDGRIELAELPAGPPLGFGGLPFESAEFELPEGTVLALYTDGFVGGGHGGFDEGLEQLRVAMTPPGRPLDDMRRAAVDALPPERDRDDAALLLARTRALGEDNVATWDLPNDPAVVSGVRADVTRLLDLWGLEDKAFTTELVVSELVTNAIRYASGPIRLRLIRDDSLICEVSDASATTPRLRHARTTDEGGRGLFLIAQFTQRWGTRYTGDGKTIWAEQTLAPPEGTVHPEPG